MRICFDLDDVLCDTYSQIMDSSADYHINVLKRKLIARKIQNAKGDYFYFAKALGWGEKEVEAFFHESYPKFLEFCEPNLEAIYKLQEIHQKGHQIIILSAREERKENTVVSLTHSWLNANDIPYDNLIIGCKNKLSVLKKIKSDIFIDDTFENCYKVSCLTNTKVYHYICEYNKNMNIQYNKKIQPINSLNEIKVEKNIYI